MDFRVLELSQYTQPVIKETTKDNWVSYGEKNDYYLWLMDRYRNSPTNNAVINSIARLAYGGGLSAFDANRKPNEYAQMLMLFKPETLRAIILETKMLGEGVFQVIYSKDRKSVSQVEHLPTHMVRPEKCDKDGHINGYYVSSDWSDIRKFPPTYVPKFGTSKENIELLVIGNYSVGRKYFHRVDYEGALDYCVLEEEIATYLVNDAQNGFSPTMIINWNNGTLTEEQRAATVRKAEQKLTGSSGKKVIHSFNDSAELATTVTPVPLDDAPQHYEYLATEARNKILAAHAVTSPMLVGISPDGQGFSSNADEIEVGSKYFYNTAIQPLQELVLDGIKQILAYNGTTLDLYFKRLDLLADREKAQQAQVNMSSEKTLEDVLSQFGEDEDLEGWELVDERKVDYDQEAELDAELKEYFKPKESLLSKVWNFVRTGEARPNQSSYQDAEVDGFYFKVRYQYAGNPTPERDFCKAMMRSNKLYRREDIELMSQTVVNAGLGEFGTDTYDIFKFKGGARCNHYWLRKTYVSTSKSIDVKSPNAPTVSTNKAEKFGYRVRNPKEAAMKPNDMPLKGFSPNNPNLPSDVR
jgi:hypothetical protein